MNLRKCDSKIIILNQNALLQKAQILTANDRKKIKLMKFCIINFIFTQSFKVNKMKLSRILY